MSTPGITTVAALRAATRRDHGVDVPNWAFAPTRTELTGCDVQPSASAEDLANRGAQRVAYTILAPWSEAAAAITGDDRIEYRGRQWPIIGDPEDWNHPNPDVAHVKILVASWRDLP